MNGQTFLDDLRDDHETELSRLGSSKAVYAFTAGEMDGGAVRAGTARELRALATVLAEWADAADGDAAELFSDVATFATETAESLEAEAADAAETEATKAAEAAEPEEHGEDEATGVTVEALAALNDQAGRTGGLAAALLVLGKLSEQLVGFFVGDADRAGAQEFREIRDRIQAFRDEAAAHVASRSSDDGDWEAAQHGATAVVEGAYDWYVETLEGMGVEPKNVC